MIDVTSLSISDIRKKLVSKSFSAKELVAAYFARIEKKSSLNSYIELNQNAALKSAEECDGRIARGEKSSLLGVPLAIKDVIITKNLRTTCGSNILSNFVPPYDATAIIKLRGAGAIVLGKTNTDEFAMGSSTENSFFGPVKNPWNEECVPGGSSGGSAAAVSAGLAPAALGSDTGGSVRQPAAFCNLVGLKPTYGRISRYGLVAYASSLDQIGIFARDIPDCTELCQVLFGHDKKDSTSVDIKVPNLSAALDGNLRGKRIGLPKEYFVGGVNVEVAKCVRAGIDRLAELGAEIVDISLPHTEYALACYYILAMAEASSNLARYDGIRFGHRSSKAHELRELYALSRSEGFGPEVKRRIMIGTYVLSTGYYDAYYLRAQRVRTLISKDFKDVFQSKCDAIVCPTTPTTAFKIGEKVSDLMEMYLNDIFTVPINLAGLPALSIPCGFDSKRLPIGLQLIGKPWDEENLLRIAHAYQQATDWHKSIPEE